jgi:hypothetical protein
MKKTFQSHFPPAEKDIKRLWETCIFVIDTNILLNLYRYSDSTRNEFIRVLHALEDRLWLPNRAAEEYFENRLTVIAQQEKAYDETLKIIQTLQADLSNTRQHPFLSDKLMRKLTPVLGEVTGELGKTRAAHAKRIFLDEIRKKIGDLFNERVGVSFSDEQIEAICKEGEDRYSKKIPPGYKDEMKDNGSGMPQTSCRKYGDLIIWHQIIDRASEAKKDVIFVNDDKKEDWYLIFRGKTLGPRPELIQEFLFKTNQRIYMYQADRFLELAAEHLKQKVTPESMDEIREIRDLRIRDLHLQKELARRREEDMRLLDEKRFREEIMIREEEAMLRSKASVAHERLQSTRSRLEYIRERTAKLERGQAIYLEKLGRSAGEDHESLEKHMDLQRRRDAAEAELVQAREELSMIESEYAKLQSDLANIQRLTKQRFARGRS